MMAFLDTDPEPADEDPSRIYEQLWKIEGFDEDEGTGRFGPVDGIDPFEELGFYDVEEGEQAEEVQPREEGRSEPTEPIEEEDLPPRPRPAGRKARPYLLALIFLVGLLLGWFVGGWWLWPTNRGASKPWHLHPTYQEVFIGLLAEEYWHTGDIGLAQQSLAGWEEERLTPLLNGLRAQASTAEERSQLDALANIPDLPQIQVSLVYLLTHQVILFGAGLSALPLLVAAILIILSLIQSRIRPSVQAESNQDQGEEGLEREPSAPPESDGLAPVEAEDTETEGGWLTNLSPRQRAGLYGLLFLTGLLVGWIVLGWWLWPVRWMGAAPHDLHPEYQRTYVGLVAERYWRTRDAAAARSALSTWQTERLANLMTKMEVEAATAEERQHLAALARALALPTAEVSSFALLDPGTIALSLLLSILPLTAVLGVLLLPLVPTRFVAPLGRIRFLAPLLRIKPRPSTEQEITAKEEELLELEQEFDYLVLSEEGDILEGEGRPPLDEEEEEDQTTEEATTQSLADEEADGLLNEEEIEDLREELSVDDILASVLEEEEEEKLFRLQMLCKGLPNIEIDDLLEESREIAHHLERSNAMEAIAARTAQ